MKIWWCSAVILFSLLIYGCEPSHHIEESQTKQKNQQEIVIDSLEFNRPFDLNKQKKSFQHTQFEVLDMSESEYDKRPVLSISFSVPIDSTVDFNQFLQVLNEQQKKVAGVWVLNQSRTRLYFANIQPVTKYQIEINKNITSINHQHLSANVKQKIKTKALKAQVLFLSKGKILPRELTNGLAVESVNIQQVDINFYRVNNNKIARVLSRKLHGYSYYLNQIPEYAELVYSARYSLDYSTNKRMTTNLPVHQVKQLKQPGLYIAVMKPAGTYPDEYSVTSFYWSNLALQVTAYEKSTMVHALSINQGKPQSDVMLEVLSGKGHILASGKTDQQGNHQLAGVNNDSVIIGQQGDNFAVITLATPALDLSEQLQHTRQQNQQELFLYGPRDLYRPGDEIKINGLLRGQDGQMIASVPLEVSVIRPDSRVTQQFTWYPTQAGFYSRQLTLEKNQPTGQWLYRVKHPDGTLYEYAFSVEDFLPERMKLALKSSVNGFADNHTNIQIQGQGDYLYGAPAAGNRIAAKMKIKPIHYPLAQLKDYYFGQADSSEQVTENNLNREIQLDDQKLDSAGMVNWMLPNLWQLVTMPTQVIVEASLFESGGRPVTRRIKQIVWPKNKQNKENKKNDQALHIGLRKLYSTDFVKPFKTAEFELINANSTGKLFPLGAIEVNLIRQDTRYYWRVNQQSWDYSNNRNDKKIYARVIETNDLKATIELPVEYGNYRVEIRDLSGALKNSYAFFAGWSWDENGENAVTGARPDKVRILFDQQTYAANETATVKLISPHLGQALIRVEADQILWESQVELTQLESEILIPISADWKRHDLYVSAMVISKSKKVSDEFVLPKRALGIAPLRLDRSDRALQLAINAPEITEPERSVTIDITVTGHNNKDAFVTLAAVDTGILSLANYKTPEPHHWFYGQRRYSGNLRDSFSQLIKNHQGRLGVLKFGGDAELARGGEQPNTDVQVVSIFSNVVKFDQNGKAQVSLELPRFNGELRLMALAFSGSQFGHQEKTMKVRAPIVAEISKPRFLAIKDQSQFGFDLQNLSGDKKQLKAKFKIHGALKQQTFEIPIQLANGEKFTQVFNMSAQTIGHGLINLSLTDEQQKEVLSYQWMLGVRAAYPAEFKREQILLKTNQSYQFEKKWSHYFKPSTLKVKVDYSSTLPLSVTTHLENLFQYPYGCLEQTSSRAWPLLNFDLNTSELKLNQQSIKFIREKDRHINAAIQRVSGMQRHDGSFGLWSNQSNENHWLTVYALEFLMKAKNAGYSVPSVVTQNGIKRLQYYVKSVNATYSERAHYSQNPQHYAIAFRAYAAYLLSHLKQINLGILKQLHKTLADQAQSGLPLAHLAVAFENLGDTKTAKSLWEKALNYQSYSLNYSGDYGSQLRDLAWTMKLASHSKLNVNYQKLIFLINDELLSKSWLSTQERFALYQLEQSFAKLKTEPWSIKILSDNHQKSDEILSQKKISQILNAKEFNNIEQVALTKGERLFIDLQAVGYAKKQPKGYSKGISTQKRYYNLQGKKINFKQIKTGDYVLVRLDVTASQKMPDALLVDMLPAGFEIENPRLEYAYDFSELKIDGYPVYQWMNKATVIHQEYRDDRFVAAIALEKKQWATLFYLTRAITPGTYEVPPTQVEDMYRPYLRSLGNPVKPVTVIAR